jgi:hypothetical protein
MTAYLKRAGPNPSHVVECVGVLARKCKHDGMNIGMEDGEDSADMNVEGWRDIDGEEVRGRRGSG